MAFSFFRRRQKMVIIIMVLLMISFLVGVQGLKGLLKSGRGGGEDTPIGDSKFGELTFHQRANAYQDIEYLQRLGVTNLRRGGSLEFVYMVVINGSEAATAFALLGQEATAMGYKVNPGEIDEWFARKGLVGEQLDAFITRLRERSPGITAGFVKQVIGRWLLVRKAYQGSKVSVPPSEVETKQLYRDLNEKINLQIAAVSALDMLDQVESPSDQEIVEHFNKYRADDLGSFSQTNSFGFGYIQPDRADVQYLLISQGAIAQISQIKSETIQNYYMDHMAEFVKTVQPPQDQDGEAATQPATAPPEQVQMSFTEARVQISQILREEMMANRMAELASRARSILDSLDAPADANPYELVAGKLLSPADDLLTRRTGSLDIQAQRLDFAIKTISDATGVQIAFPMGNIDQYMIDPAIEITLAVGDASLSEALSAVTRQIPGIELLTWVKCVGMGDAVFSAGPASTLPVVAGQTGLADFSILQSDQILAYSMAGPGQYLIGQVFTARPFGGTSGMEVGSEGPKMRVFGVTSGELLWRLAGAEPTHALDAITSGDDLSEVIRSQVIDGIKTEKAYVLALDKAKALEAQAEATDLKTAAEAQEISISETGLFARKVQLSPQQMALQQMQMRGQLTEQTLVLALLEAPHAFVDNRVPGVALPETVRRAFLQEAFTLAPENVDPPYTDDKPITAIGVESRAEVVVAQRIGFEPAVLANYETPTDDMPSGKVEIMTALEAVRNWQVMVNWFNYKNIVDRTDFEVRQFQGPAEDIEAEPDGLAPDETTGDLPSQRQPAE